MLHTISEAATAQDETGSSLSSTGVTVTDAGNRVIYSPDYFAPYNVVTARDQLERIPGLQEIFDGGQDDQRGFGNSGDQVLINGKRLSGKSNDIGSAMDRIQARQVVRIEVIRGTVSGLDVRSQGRVVNVVLDGTLVTGLGSWQAYAEDYSDSSYGGGGEVSYSGDVGALNYLVSAQLGTRKNMEDRTDLFFTPDNLLFERQLEAERERAKEHSVTTNTSYTFGNNDILNLNGRYAYTDETGRENSDRFVANPDQLAFSNSLFIAGTDLGKEWELGGDYEHVLDSGNVFTGLFVYTQNDGDEDNSFSITPVGRPTVLRELQVESQQSSEKIVRGTYEWGATDTHSIQSGAEFALNSVTQRVELFEDENGTLVEVPLFNQDSTVEEQRVEAFSTYTWQPRPALLVEGSVDLEFSEISQEGGDVNRSRDLFFARPRFVVRYDLSPLTQVRSRIERRVDQLDFGDFVASFSNDDNRVDVISAGNPELVPEQAMEYELTYEHRLPDDLGVFTATGLYADIRDRISSVPLVVQDENGVTETRTATGNIDSARLYELSLNGSLRLGWLNLRTAVIEASLQLRDMAINDPFTGEERNFNFTAPYEWSLGFRHDTRWRNLSYGITAERQGESQQYNIDFDERAQSRPELELFLEMQPVENLTVGLSVEEALRVDNTRERLQYDGIRSDGLLERRELRTSRQGREITLTVQGIF
ncbi:MAG: outer membrane beta-barrel protein [Pseudomonadota bacterium]